MNDIMLKKVIYMRQIEHAFVEHYQMHNLIFDTYVSMCFSWKSVKYFIKINAIDLFIFHKYGMVSTCI